MLQKVEEYAARWDMLKKEDRIIVGVSGGADSICLLFVLLELQKKIPFEMMAVHVNHGLRKADADADEAYVKEICKAYGIPVQTYFKNVEWIAQKRKQSAEEAGRDVRREVFLRAMKAYGGTKIALAHHKNDNAETFFMNLARGTGLKGLGGIRPVSGVYIRPLLCLERREIEEYLRGRGIRYCEDATNRQDEYTRNRIRNHVIPYMEQEINAKTVSHIAETMRQLQETQAYLEAQTDERIQKAVKEEVDGYWISKEAFDETAKALRPLLLKTVLARLAGKEKDLEGVHLETLQNLFEKQVGRQADLPYGIAARRVYGGIRLYRKPGKGDPVCFELDFSDADERTFLWKGKRIACRLLDREKADRAEAQKSGAKWFDYDIIGEDKLCIRTRQAGDYIVIHSDGRRQKIKAWFINRKIPQEERDGILLLADGCRVIWILGMRSDAAYQVHKHTKRILEIRIVDEGERYGRDNQSTDSGAGCGRTDCRTGEKDQ